jgi:lipopolysaccharide export system protein LptC
MQKIYSSKAFQFFAVIIIASLCLLLNTLTQINFHKMSLPKTHPQYNVKGITGGVYNKQGKMLYALKSPEAFEYPDDERIYIKNLELNLFSESSNDITYSVTSNDAWINRETKVGLLGESSVLKMYNPDPKQVVTIYGKNINLDMNSNIFSSDEDAKALQGNGTVYTHGFKYDNKKHFLVLTSKVRVVYEQ